MHTRLIRTAVLDGGRTHASYFNAGVRSGSLGGLCRFTQDHSLLVKYINLFLQSVFQDATWTSFCVSHNEFAHLHSDFNASGSLNHTCSLGAFEKGGLWVSAPADFRPHLERVPPPDEQADGSLRGVLVCTRRQGFSFDGSWPHCSEPWSGDRWVITAYTSAQLGSVSEQELRQLRDLSFPLPGEASTSSALSQEDRGLAALSHPVLPSPASPVDLSKVQGNLFLEVFAGHARPLSMAFLHAGVSVLSIDTMLSQDHDLLDNAVFEPLLRLCFSGAVSLAHASPPCKEYSRCKLRQPGPKPLRSPEHLPGLPGLSAVEFQRLQESSTLMSRGVELLHATFKAGGHFSLENPANSMLWLEEPVRLLLQKASADVLVLAACQYDWDISKRWAFATTFRDMQQLAKDCPHTEGSHAPVAGVRDAFGGYVSQQTSEFPAALAQAYCNSALPLFKPQVSPADVSIGQLYQLLPIKGQFEMPVAHQDGAGIFSVPDWSFPPSGMQDKLKPVRQALVHKLFEIRAPLRLREHVHARAETPLFTEAEVEVFRSIFADFMEANTARKVDWSIQPFQPYTLRALQQLSEALEDPDTDLFARLQAGAPTGFFKDIPRSGIFVPVQADAIATEQPLLLCDENWKGARDNPETLAALVQEELENGWLEEVPLEEARIRWKEIAIGKMNVLLVPDKNPRLTVDATVSGVNQGCVIPERYNLPGLGDLQAGYPLRGRQTEISSFSLDIKAAHKSLLMRERDRGLAGITFQGRTFFYRVMPFGMSCSAYWWQRLSAFFIRTWHLLLFWAHFLSMYVDDLILTTSTGALDISACLLLAFAASFGIRISWPKLQLGSDILWIGWQLCYRAGTVRVPDIKRHKLRSLIRPLLTDGRVELKAIQQVLGLLQWVTQLHIALRPWLSSLYDDISRPPGTSYSIAPAFWDTLAPCLSEALIFTATPQGTAIPVGSKLLSARHVPLESKADLRRVR